MKKYDEKKVKKKIKEAVDLLSSVNFKKMMSELKCPKGIKEMSGKLKSDKE